LVSIGTREKSYNGAPYDADEIIIIWELPYALRSDGKPFTVQETYTRSIGKKANLRRILVNWRGRDFTAEEIKNFEIKNILDVGCQVIISENEKGYTHVTGTAGLPKGVVLPERQTSLLQYDVVEDDEAAFNNLPKYLQDKVAASYEYQELRQYGRVLADIERSQAKEAARQQQQFTGSPNVPQWNPAPTAPAPQAAPPMTAAAPSYPPPAPVAPAPMQQQYEQPPAPVAVNPTNGHPLDCKCSQCDEIPF